MTLYYYVLYVAHLTDTVISVLPHITTTMYFYWTVCSMILLLTLGIPLGENRRAFQRDQTLICGKSGVWVGGWVVWAKKSPCKCSLRVYDPTHFHSTLRQRASLPTRSTMEAYAWAAEVNYPIRGIKFWPPPCSQRRKVVVYAPRTGSGGFSLFLVSPGELHSHIYYHTRCTSAPFVIISSGIMCFRYFFFFSLYLFSPTSLSLSLCYCSMNKGWRTESVTSW